MSNSAATSNPPMRSFLIGYYDGKGIYRRVTVQATDYGPPIRAALQEKGINPDHIDSIWEQ